MDANEMMAMRGGLTPYETFMMNEKTSRRPSGTAVGALAVGVGAAVLAIGAGAWAGAQASKAKEVAIAKNDGLRDLVQTLAGTLAAERAERISGDTTISQTITDTVSGSQQGTLTAQQQAELSAVQSVQNQLFTQAVMGNLSENAQKVQLYSAPQPCGCPGCNG